MTVQLTLPTLTFNVDFPSFTHVRQPLDSTTVPDLDTAIGAALVQTGLPDRLKPGERVAITAGSRGVAQIADVIRLLVAHLKSLGAVPFVVPAMGSHGGGTPEGQREMLASFGITEAYVGAPIRSEADVIPLGEVQGIPTYIDRNAHSADHILIVNRIKPHTDFHGEIESGIAKMIAIGLGKHHSASVIHARGSVGLARYIPPIAQHIVHHAPIAGGIAILESGIETIAEVVGLTPEQIGTDCEKALLKRAASRAARLPFKQIDVLIVEAMGKNFSGTGMDTNVLGKLAVAGQPTTLDPLIMAIVKLDLADGSHGNAAGLGLADVVTQRLVEKIDWDATYMNALTATQVSLWRNKLPPVAATDRDAIGFAFVNVGQPDPQAVRAVRIRSTLHLTDLWLSPALLEESGLTPLGPSEPLRFDEKGTLLPA